MCNCFDVLESELINNPGKTISFMNSYAEVLDYGRHSVATMDIIKPCDEIRARTVDPAHVKALVTSFKKWNNAPTDIQVLVMFESGSVSSDSKIKEVNALPLKRTFDFEEWYPTLKLHGFQVICGDHTVEAIKSLLHKFQSNPMWKRLTVQVYLGLKSDPDVARWAHLWGTADNMKKAVQRRVTVVEQLIETHRLFFAHPKIDQFYANNNSGKGISWVRQFKKDRSMALSLKHGLFGQIWTVAQKKGPFWDLIERIFLGVGCHDDHMAPKSVSHFIHTSGIPQELLLGWLNDICIGQSNPLMFQTLCYHYKARSFIRRKILERLSTQFKRPATGAGSLSWDDACSRYKNITDYGWIESFVPGIGHGIKKTLSEIFVTAMEKRLSNDIDFAAGKLANKQQVSLF